MLPQALRALALLPAFVLAAPSPASPPASADRLLDLRGPAPEGYGSLNFTFDAQIYPPPVNASAAGQTIPDNLKVSCKGCSITGDLIFSAGNEGDIINVTPGPNVTNAFVNKTNFDFTDQWLAMVMHDFKVHIQLEIDLTPSNDSNELDIHLLGSPKIIEVPEVPGLLVEIDPQIHGWLNVSKPVTFTYGMDIVVPSGATVLIDAISPDDTVAPGFNETKFTPLPFQSSTDDIEMAIELSFRPQITLSYAKVVEVGTIVDLPKLGVQISQVQNVDAKCAPAAQNAKKDDVFARLTKLEPKVGMDFILTVQDHEFPPLGFDNLLDGVLPEGCFEYDPKTKTLVAPGSLKAAAGKDGKGSAVGARRASLALTVLCVLLALAL